MLRITPRVLRVSKLTSGLRTFASIAADKDNVETGTDIIENFIADNQVIVKGASLEQFTPWVSFDNAPFSAKVKSILRTEGFEKPSPIQAVSWPIAFAKKDIISVAKMGSGKTLGFILPGFHKIMSEGTNKPPRGTSSFCKSVQMLVLAPTREHCNQIAAEASKYHATDIDTVCLYGGASKGGQMAKLRRGADCVVATPGRCMDLIDEGAFDISQVRYLVLDEADIMLDTGLDRQIRLIIDQLPTAAQGRQTLFFTATLPNKVQSLAAQFLSEPVQINIGAQDTLNANKDIKQNVMIVKQFQKLDALLDLLEQRINVSANPKALPKTIIFAATKASCNELQQYLRRVGYSAAALHGDKSQQMRDDVMSAFRRGRVSILIATDIAARGLDVKDIKHVVNFDFPNQVEDYVHRIGRTGRAGAAGSSHTFLNLKDLDNRRNMSDLVDVLIRCEQEVPAPLEDFRTVPAKHSTEERNRAISPTIHPQQGQEPNMEELVMLIRELKLATGPRSFAIPPLAGFEGLVEALAAYMGRGEALRRDAKCQELTSCLDQSVAAGLSEGQLYPTHFYFVEASSGMGKSQLAFSLSLPLVYIPLGETQRIYQCFQGVSRELHGALDLDGKEFGLDLQQLRSLHLYSSASKRYHTVGLLVALCRAVKGKTNPEALRLLSGRDGKVTITHEPMTLAAARVTIQEEGLYPLFFIDEVPSMDNSGHFDRCILLRNLIRCMHGTCVLSGTEAAAMNVIDDAGPGSRGEEVTDYLRLLVDLPPTHWAAFAEDPRYAALIESLEGDTLRVLKQTRPLFVQYALEAMLRQRARELSASVLSAMKKTIVADKRLFCSNDGLYGQLALVHSAFIAETSREPTGKGQIDTSRDAIHCVRHHFGKLRLHGDTTRERVARSVVRLFLSDGEMLVPTRQGRRVFKLSGMFPAPHEDPLLYLTCLRDGIFWITPGLDKVRVPTSFGLHEIYQRWRSRGTPLFLNTKQKSSSGKALEMEVGSAAVVASHSYGSDGSDRGLAGSPVSFFIRSLVAELNPHQPYVAQSEFELRSLPVLYDTIRVPLLSAVNAKWKSGEDAKGTYCLQNGTIVLANYNDGSFAVRIGTGSGAVWSTASVEGKCHQDNVPTDEILNTAMGTVMDQHLITFMVVAKLAGTRNNNKAFFNDDNVRQCYVLRIGGTEDSVVDGVAREIACEVVREDPTAAVGSLPKHTVVVLDLETIYPGRYDLMWDYYQST